MGTEALINLQLRMFIIMLIGLYLRRKNMITDNGKKLLTNLVINVILPCNIIKSFMIEFNMSILYSFAFVLIISICIQVVCMILGQFLFNHRQDSQRKVLQYATAVSNAGFLGNPIAEGVFGSMGLAYASIYLIPQRIVMWSAGISYFTESMGKKDLLKKVLTHPCIIAVEIGLFFMFTQLSLPTFLDSALTDLSNCNTAISMLVIGTILAELTPKQLLDASILRFSVLRLVLIPLAVYIGCLVFKIDPLVTGVSVLLAAMPAATTTALLASQYDGDAPYATKSVVVTTILSLVSTPIWSMILLQAL